MKQLIARFGLPVIVVALMLLAGLPRTVERSDAATLAVVTGTPTEPPTRTPTDTPTTGTATPTPTATPTKKPPSKPGFADPAITKSASVGEARIGDEVAFTISVTNLGNETAADVVVTDSLADYLDLLDVTTTRGDVSVGGQTVTVNVGEVAPGDVVSVRIRTRVNERAQPPGGRNGATVTTTSPGDDPSNNTSEVTFTIGAAPTPTATPELQQSPAPPAPPVRPSRLPRTGTPDDGSSGVVLAAALGLAAVGVSLLLRRRARR
jgi:uncharacterized repeat protein (TIGR01451 family)/MYXO-CTERM domain-containing protein